MSANGWTILLATLLALTVTLSVVVLLLERPRQLERFVHTRYLAVVTLGLSTLAIIGVVVHQDRSSPSATTSTGPSNAVPIDTVLRLVHASDNLRTIPANLIPPLSQVATASNLGFPPPSTGCVPDYEQSSVPSCIFGDRTGAHTMILYGDSHAGMWFQALDDIATRSHWKLILLFKPACLASPLSTHPPMVTGTSIGEWTACDLWHRFAIDRINGIDPNLLIVTQSISGTPQGIPYTPTQWQHGLELLLRKVTAPRTKKVVLGDIPLARGSDCLAQHRKDVLACSAGPLTLYNRAELLAATSARSLYINVTPWFCAKKCSPIIGNYDVYFDGSHVSEGYSRFLEGVLAQKLAL